MKKKFVWIAIATVALLTGIFWGIPKIRQSHFNQQFHELNLAIIEDVPSIDMIGNRSATAFQSKIHFFSQKNHAINDYISDYLDHKKLPEKHILNQEWLIVYPKTTSTSLKDVAAYHLIEKSYHTSGLSVIADNEKVLDTFYAAADGKEITLDDIIADKESFRQTLKEIFSETETTEKHALNAQEHLIKTFESNNWSTIDFVIKNNTLILDKAIFSLSIFVNSLNPYYFTEGKLTSFQEQEAERKNMKTAKDTVTIHYDNPIKSDE